MNYSLGRNFFRGGLDFFERGNQTNTIDFLKTDIIEKKDAYYLMVEIPGVNKENIEIDYENGYLTVAVKQDVEQEVVEEYIRKERYTSEMQRTFYVGNIEDDDIKAGYQNGVLTITLKKQEEKLPEKKQIIIE